VRQQVLHSAEAVAEPWATFNCAWQYLTFRAFKTLPVVLADTTTTTRLASFAMLVMLANARASTRLAEVALLAVLADAGASAGLAV
jgi:hypothetical protein